MIWTIFKKEVKETLFAMKGITWFVVVAVLFSVLCLAIVSVKELSLMAQTEVILTFTKLALAIGVGIGIILASVSFSHEREADTLESLLLTPITKFQLVVGKLSSSIVISLGVYVIAIPYLVGLAYKTGTTFTAIALLFIMGLLLTIAFSLIAFGISILFGNSKNAIITSIIVIVVMAIPSFLSTTTKKAGFAMIINKTSPVSNTFNFLKEIIINKQGVLVLVPILMPIIVFLILAILFLTYSTHHMDYKGGE